MMIFDKRLKPCPLCGSTEIYLEAQPYTLLTQMNVGCATCGLKGYKQFLMKTENKEEKTIEYWNTRKGE